MELSSTFKCPCRPEFTYKNAHALAIHKKMRIYGLVCMYMCDLKYEGLTGADIDALITL